MDEERNKQDEGRDDVATLLRLAGKREPVPRERYDRVRTAAYEAWQRETERPRRRRVPWAVAGLLAAASLIAAMLLIFPLRDDGVTSDPGSWLRVEALSASLQVRESSAGPGAPPRDVFVGDVIAAEAVLVTPEDGRAALRLASGHSLRLDTATRLRWHGRSSFSLDRGAVYVDSGADPALGRQIEIRTPLGSVREVGTQFELRLREDSLQVSMREGVVALQRDEGAREIEAGTALQVRADGIVTRQAIEPDAAEWEWAGAIAPMPELAGRPVRALLDWVSRERGWRLEFADDSVARSADEILLDGTFSHLSLDQALDAILPTCRMTYRVRLGRLLVSADTGIPAGN